MTDFAPGGGESMFVTRGEAARLLSSWGLITKPNTLATKASRGGGPPYRYYGGRALYETAELRNWALQAVSESASSTTVSISVE